MGKKEIWTRREDREVEQKSRKTRRDWWEWQGEDFEEKEDYMRILSRSGERNKVMDEFTEWWGQEVKKEWQSQMISEDRKLRSAENNSTKREEQDQGGEQEQ